MKTILYKVWDFEGGKDGKGGWIEDSTGFSCWVLSPEGKVVLRAYISGGRSIVVPYTPGRFDILLWTGEKDRKGNDIYDGHLIQRDVSETYTKEYFESETKHQFHNAVGMVKLVPFGFDVELISDHADWAFYDPQGRCWDNREVTIVGHKYENPELLPGKNE